MFGRPKTRLIDALLATLQALSEFLLQRKYCPLEVASDWSTQTANQKLWCEIPAVTIMAAVCRNTFPCWSRRLQTSLCINYNSLQRASSIAQTPGNQRGPQRGRRRRDDGPASPSRRPMVPRAARMAEDQDWPSVWPTAATFKPSAVPLPVRMGFPLNRGVQPDKIGNNELRKVPNFLHLTPVAVKRHCEVLKQFCTDWPAALETDEACEEHFPLEVITTDYVLSGPSLRHPEARIVTLKLKLSQLELDDHARKKLLKLVGDRYDKETDTLTITADRCPHRKQNYDYTQYLLTVLYLEAWKTEPWEAGITPEDRDEFLWEGSPSEQNIVSTIRAIQQAEKGSSDVTEEEIVQNPDVQLYKQAVVNQKNLGESSEHVQGYKDSVKRLLGLN
ncbi:small ribosomal subunit protein mS35-like [Branchiostoma lanceolatum]|uniref:small ribosomal subunit protein mS35-like n=1 Tax=Branchiostoma lanceolatum TaxID=7740 RepID=UPI0034554F20